MKKNLLSLFLGVLFVSMTGVSYAADLSDKHGAYIGSLLIGVGGEFPDPEDALKNQIIEITAGRDDSHMTLSLKNFTFIGLNLGDINLIDVPVTVNGNEVFFQENFKITGLVLNAVGAVDVTVMPDSYIGVDKSILVNLKIDTTHPAPMEVLVQFDGGKSEENSIGSQVINSTVYYDVQSKTVIVPSDAVYQIYNLAGQLVKSGRANGNQVLVTDLRNGLYLIKAAGVTTKFVKN